MRIAVLVFALALSGCEERSKYLEGMSDLVRYTLPVGAMSTLENADVIEVLALGDVDDEGHVPHTRYGAFDGRPVVALARLPRSRHAGLVTALYEGVQHGDWVGMCFIPHHGLRVWRGHARLDISVCFTCLQMRVLGGKLAAIDPGPLATVLDPPLAEVAHVRFTEDERTHRGAWVPITP